MVCRFCARRFSNKFTSEITNYKLQITNYKLQITNYTKTMKQ